MSKLSIRLNHRLAQADQDLIYFQGQWYSSKDLMRDATIIQSMLRESGIQTGDRILLAEINSYAFVATYIGILLHGAVVVPVNPAMPEPELTKVMGRAEVSGAIVNADLMGGVRKPDVRPLAFVATVSDGSGSFAPRWFTATEHTSPQSAAAQTQLQNEISEDAGAILLFTSGTTGTPKGVLLTHRQVMTTVNNVVQAHELTTDDVCYAFLPLFHINAQVIGMLSTIISGGKIVLEKKFSASRFWTTVHELGVTWISAVPTIIAILIKSDGSVVHPHRVRFVRSASAPLPALQAKRFETRFGIPLIESYGMTEAASQICVNPVPPGVRKFGSVGLPCGVELRIADEHGRSLRAGQIGEIAIRGDSVVSSYASGDANGSGFRHGWFFTGDIGYLDSEGYVFITGRSKEMINRAGQKVSPREVEEVIGRDPEVKTVAVIGLPDDLYGEKVVAYIIAEDVSEDRRSSFVERVRKMCAASISAYKCPAEFHLVDEIPVGPTGKIQRQQLRTQVLAVSNR